MIGDDRHSWLSFEWLPLYAVTCMKLIKRRNTSTVDIGGILMGADQPIRIQSMTNTVTQDVAATVEQIKSLADAGSEYVRITVNDLNAAQAVPDIVHQLRDQGYNTPIIGDFHYNGHILLTKYPKAADALAKYRINPGNVGKGDKRDDNFATMIQVAKDHNRPVRIGLIGALSISNCWMPIWMLMRNDPRLRRLMTL